MPDFTITGAVFVQVIATKVLLPMPTEVGEKGVVCVCVCASAGAGAGDCGAEPE